MGSLGKAILGINEPLVLRSFLHTIPRILDPQVNEINWKLIFCPLNKVKKEKLIL